MPLTYLRLGTQREHGEGKFYTAHRKRRGEVSPSPGRANYGNCLSPIPAIHAEVGFVDGKDIVSRIEFAHSDQTEISKVRLAIRVSVRQVAETDEIFGAIKR